MNKIGYNQRGLSLIEFMVAGAIGLILTLGLFQIFVSNQRAFTVTGASSYVQESGRMATEILSKAIRNADYWGCVSRSSVFNNLNIDPTDDVLGFGQGVNGEDNNSDSSDAVINGTDVLTLRGARGSNGMQTDSPMPNSSAVLDVKTSAGLEEGEVVVISNCRGADIFQITSLPGSGDKIQHNTGSSVSPGNGKNVSNCGSSNCLSQLYDKGSDILRPYSDTYYVGTGTSGQPALFLRSGLMKGSSIGSVQAIELVEGVEDMQVLYGEDTNGDGAVNRYVSAGSVTDMASVIALRISLLVRSAEDSVLDTSQNVTFDGVAVDGSDRRLRRVYSMTSTIRNRI
ncbi:PilW family protein [Marinobacter fonticola]|uniref:PilW family protein n=1 Tax=Marinobacter fonticola TaxID=2603215 RepID=UPI0011E7E000|nr:PilW family protein [Marinobacter fonticola]